MVGQHVGWNRGLRRALLLTSLAGCGDDGTLDTGGSSDATSVESTSTSDPSVTTTNVDTSATESTGVDTTDGTTTTTTTTDATTTTESTGVDTTGESSTTGMSIGCDDGLPAPGEVCLVPVGVAGDAVEAGRGLAAGDVDGDGDIDLFTAAQLLRNDGGTFAPTDPYAIDGGGYPAAGRLGADDDLDVVVPSDVVAWVLVGDGSGALSPETELPLTGSVYATAIADVVGSNRADVLAVTLDGEARIFEGGEGNDFVAGPSNVLANELRDAAAGDFDGDGRADFVAASYGEGAHVLIDGTWNDWPGTSGYQQIALGDLDGDGDLDLVGTLLAGMGDGLELQRGDGSGGAIDATLIPLPFFTRAVAIADVDGDDILDLVAPSYADELAQVAVLLGVGDGTFADPIVIEAPVHASDVIAAELNGDGSIDFAFYGTATGDAGSTGEEAQGPVLLLLSNP